MFNVRRALAPILISVSALAFAPAPILAPCDAQPLSCVGGPAHGSWQLPRLVPGHGQMDGHLVDFATGAEFRIRALLLGHPDSCTTCIHGDIRGFVEDGSGGASVFLVRGSYEGASATGSGRFELRVYSPNSSQELGRITGTFDDAPGDGHPGRFLADWRVCR